MSKMLAAQRLKFNNLLEKTNDVKKFYENNIDQLNDIIQYLEEDNVELKENDNVETVVLKKYIEEGSIKRVCEFINSAGYRIITKYSDRKYTTDDISQIIFPYPKREGEEKKVVNADERLKSIAKEMHIYFYGSVYGVLRVKDYK